VGEEAVAEINAFLPDDLRVFSCSKVTGGFRPRDAVSYRWGHTHTHRGGARRVIAI
jgi:tRNA U38,U39,U40 pseudouridine synthase TruA